MGIVSDLIATVRSTFRIKQATLDASGLTAPRTFTLPDVAGGLVIGPASATDGAFALFNTTTGKLLKEAPNLEWLSDATGRTLLVKGPSTDHWVVLSADMVSSVLYLGSPGATKFVQILQSDTESQFTAFGTPYVFYQDATEVARIALDGTFVAPLAEFTVATISGAPTAADDVVNKAYADGLIAGVSPKQSVQAATAAALPANTYSNGASGVGATLTAVATGVLTTDGYTVGINDRVLVKNQAAGLQNGIYTCTVAGAIGVAYVLTRATDNDISTDIEGCFTFSENGTVNAACGWVNTNVGTLTVGTTAVTFSQFSGAGSYSASGGLDLTGTVFSIATGGVTLAKMADMATASLIGRNTAGTGVPEVLSAATVKTLLAIASTDISDFTEASQDVIGAMVAAAGGSYNDGAGTITLPGGSGFPTVAVDCDFGSPGQSALVVDVSDASAVTTQQVNSSISGTQPTGVDFDEFEMDPILVAASVPSNGTVRLNLISINGTPITGQRRVNYALAA